MELLPVNVVTGWDETRELRGDEFAYAKEQREWERAGVRIVRVCSKPDPGYGGARGYVQDALLTLRPEVTRAAAFLSGSKGMVAGTTEVLTGLGLPREKI